MKTQLSQINHIRAFNRFYTNFLGVFNERLLESPVSLTEGRILFEIAGHPGCKAKDLMEILRMDRGYLSRTLARLEASGWVKREPNTSDKRVRTLRLTSRGDRLLKTINRKAAAHIESILKGIDKTKRRQLISAMAEIESILSASGPKR